MAQSSRPWHDDDRRGPKWRPLAAECGRVARVAAARGHATSRQVGTSTLRFGRRQLPWFVGAVEPWRLLVGALAVLAPAMVLALLEPALPVTTPGVVLLVAVAFSASLADWAGGITALTLAALLLNALFVGDRRFLNLPDNGTEAVGFTVTLVCGAGLIFLIEQIKREGADQRRAAAAARAATHALAALEQTVSAADAGEAVDRAALPRAIVNAMVRVNRAHAGALIRIPDDAAAYDVVASYGLTDASRFPVESTGLVAEVARQRRPIAVGDLADEAAPAIDLFLCSNVRSALGVPVIGPNDDLFGVAVIGLLVEHRFTATEVARLEAIARRAALLLAAAEVADERESQLDSARQEERRLKLVILAMPEAVIITAPTDGSVVGYNAAAEALFGRLSDDAGPVDVAERLRPVEGQPVNLHQLPHLAALATGMTVEGVELVVTRVDGRETPVLASAAPIQDADGNPAAVVTVFRDIAALKEAARLKDEFLSVVSHELRSPLTPILGFVQLVARELAKAGDHDLEVQRLGAVQGHVDRMNRLIEDLLDVSSLKSGTLDIRPERIDLVQVCREVAEGRSASAGRHLVRFEADAPAIIGFWDADRLHQVVDNLVGNAIKYSPDGGTVTLSVWNDSVTGEAVLTVADQGPGIPAEDREQVFAAFYRTRDAAESQTAGLGLGLYICHELVAAHGGRIEAGDAPGGGASFSVHLPLAAQVAAA